MTNRSAKSLAPLFVIMLALAAWGTYHTIGVFRAELVQPDGDVTKAILKAVIVFLSMAAFLSFWGMMLFLRKRKEESQNKEQPSCQPSAESPSDRT